MDCPHLQPSMRLANGTRWTPCIRYVRYFQSTEDPRQHAETSPVARGASGWNQDCSSQSCRSKAGLLSRVCSPGPPESTGGCAQVSSLSPPVSAPSNYNGAYSCLRSDICCSCVCKVMPPTMAGVCRRGDYATFCPTVH